MLFFNYIIITGLLTTNPCHTKKTGVLLRVTPPKAPAFCFSNEPAMRFPKIIAQSLKCLRHQTRRPLQNDAFLPAPPE